MKPHKWAKEIKAWADGAVIQFNSKEFGGWTDIENDVQPEWNEHTEYRIKPQPKDPQYLYVYEDIGGINITSGKNYATKDMEYIGKIKLETEDD